MGIFIYRKCQPIQANSNVKAANITFVFVILAVNLLFSREYVSDLNSLINLLYFREYKRHYKTAYQHNNTLSDLLFSVKSELLPACTVFGFMEKKGKKFVLVNRK